MARPITSGPPRVLRSGRLANGAAALARRVLGIVIGTVLHELTSRRLWERHVWMDFLGATHRCLNKLLVIIREIERTVPLFLLWRHPNRVARAVVHLSAGVRG